MPYQVKAIFGPTIQGEGLHQGMPCVFVRLSGCNAWDGRPETRAASACPYCDTDFRSGIAHTIEQIHTRLDALNPSPHSGCVLTGGEPLLQADTELIAALAARFSWVDIETNGTRPCPPHPANVYISCSPKWLRDQPIVVQPTWWKILIPDQHRFLDHALASGIPVFVQPTCPDNGPTDPAYQTALHQCLELCYTRGCRLSVQLHKVVGVE